VLKPLASSSKLKEILSASLTKMAKFVLSSLIRSRCVVTHIKLSPPTPKAMNCVSMIMSKKLITKCVSMLEKSSKVVFIPLNSQGRKGRVLHTYQSFFAFLHNRDIAENGGVFVTRVRSLASLAPKGNLVRAGADLSKMNPAMVAPTGGMVGSGAMGRGPRDRDIGTTVMVVKGAHKGYAGTIKDTNGPIARVELRTGNKVITIEKEKLYRR